MARRRVLQPIDDDLHHHHGDDQKSDGRYRDPLEHMQEPRHVVLVGGVVGDNPQQTCDEHQQDLKQQLQTIPHGAPASTPLRRRSTHAPLRRHRLPGIESPTLRTSSAADDAISTAPEKSSHGPYSSLPRWPGPRRRADLPYGVMGGEQAIPVPVTGPTQCRLGKGSRHIQCALRFQPSRPRDLARMSRCRSTVATASARMPTTYAPTGAVIHDNRNWGNVLLTATRTKTQRPVMRRLAVAVATATAATVLATTGA